MKLPNGYGSVVKLSGHRRKPFMVRITSGWTDEGKPIRKVLGYHATRKEALACLTEYNAAPYDLSNRSLTVKEVYQKWVKWRYIDRGEEDKQPYQWAWKHCSALYDMPFSEIRTRHVQGVIDDSPNGFTGKKNIKTLFNQLFKYAIQQEIVNTNHAHAAQMPKQEESAMHKPFTEEELNLLWEHTDEFGVRLALIYCYSGMRPTELLQITTNNVHLDEHYVIGGIKTESGKNRAIPIADKILPFIKAMYDPDNEYLVIDPFDGKPMLTYWRLKNHAWIKSPTLNLLDHRPHDGRHTCATMLDNAEVSLKTTQLILGHRSASITHRVYTHKTIQQLLDAINKI